MKIQITGATGFVGQNLLNYLENHNFATASLSLRKEDWKINFDTKADAIIHLAGKAHDTKNTSEASDYFKINTELTKELFNVFLQSEAKDFIYFSSVKAAADEVIGILDENVSPNPKTTYGISKLKAEEYILSKELPQGKRVFIIRPCMIHGPGNKGNLNLLYGFAKKGLPYPLASYENKRSFLSIENLCFAVEQLLVQDIASGIYQFADDESLSTNEVIELAGKSLGKKTKMWKISKALIDAVAKAGDSLKLPLNSERLQKLTENYVVSNDKIVKAMGKPFPVSSREGLLKTFESFRK